MLASVRGGLFYALVLCSVLATFLALVLVRPAPLAVRYRVLAAEAGVILALLRVCCGVRHEVEGLNHIPAEPVVFLAKHQSAWETMAFMRLLPVQSFVLKKELIDTPMLGFGLKAMAPVAIDRSAGRHALKAVLEDGRARLAAGRCVTVFPEGTRVAPGQTAPWRRSGAELARSAGVAVVPIAHNSGSHWLSGRIAKRPGVIRVRIGPALRSDGATAAALTAEAQRWADAATAELEMQDRHDR